MEAAYVTSAQRMADLERRICALEARTRGVIWSGAASDGRQETDTLVQRYGESVDKTSASRILGVTRVTVYAMLEDGRIALAQDGRRVDVRSIAAHLARKAEANARRKNRKKKAEGNCNECA